ncbi:MAG TPA: acyltransferase [Rhizomicrobium sp.]|nr:acyltransferase [Rhizomicrobium sp.]
MAGGERLTSLDAVRGIAASVVVAGHAYFAMPDPWRAAVEPSAWSIVLEPFHNGDAAVVIFFVLSGCVLSLPYAQARELDYRRYLVRRVCRIYIPFAVAVVLSYVLYCAVGHRAAPVASDWFNTLWPAHAPDTAGLAAHLLMTGTAPDIALNPPMWSLVYEMRVSLIFPLLVLLARNTRLAVLMSLALFAGALLGLNRLGENTHPAQAATVIATLCWTAEIVPYFAAGILLTMHRATLSRAWNAMPSGLRLLSGAGVFVIFSIRPSFAHLDNDLLYLVGAGVVIVAAHKSEGLRRVLDMALPQWLGRISYSLYLTHLPVMLAIFPLLESRIAFAPAMALTVTIAFAVAELMHRLVESPAMTLGRRLTRRAWVPVGAPAPERPL